VRTPRVVALVIAAAALTGLAGCGLRVNPDQAGSTTTIANSGATSTTGATGTTETSTAAAPPSTTPLPVSGSPSAGPQSTTPVTAGEDTTAQLQAVYDTFLADISGLDDNLNQSWLSAIKQVVTPRLLKAAQEQAETILAAHEHGTGTLKDAHQVVKVTGPATASIFDCLDEVDWYLVEDASGQPDPGITRGDYVGIADLILQDGHWYVDIWQPSQGQCRF
jgi:hypothetical protein